MASDIPAAIGRAQAWLADVDCCPYVGEIGCIHGEERVRAKVNLAALGPPSVALAAALYARSHAGGCTPGKCDLCDALQDWADAQDGEERGKVT